MRSAAWADTVHRLRGAHVTLRFTEDADYCSMHMTDHMQAGSCILGIRQEGKAPIRGKRDQRWWGPDSARPPHLDYKSAQPGCHAVASAAAVTSCSACSLCLRASSSSTAPCRYPCLTQLCNDIRTLAASPHHIRQYTDAHTCRATAAQSPRQCGQAYGSSRCVSIHHRTPASASSRFPSPQVQPVRM